MKSIGKLIILIALLAAALAAGYWWGNTKSLTTAANSPGAVTPKGKILYYRNPMGQPDTSPVPKKAPDGMDYIPVYADDTAGAQPNKPNAKILYYRNPMGLPDTSPVPKKDPMGMEYVPVYEGGEPASSGPVVKINPDRVQKLGVRTEIVEWRELTRTVLAVATIQANERQLHTISPRFEGWIQKLHVNTTGQLVRQGEPLLEVYSPDLVIAQQEYLLAGKGVDSMKGASPEIESSMRTLVDSALQRLRNWDISETELQRLQQEGKVRQSITLRAQASGVVLEKRAVAGMRFMPGEMLYQIADLSSVWVVADVFEQDLGLVRQGQSVNIRVDAYPDKAFTGTVTFIYPTVMAETRTAKVRIELSNTARLLKPAMYARVEIASRGGRGKVLAVPDSAVLDTGTRQLVLVQRGEGSFEPRPLKLGMRSDGYIEVLDGIKAGENVVVSANFLIDAESNLKAALSGFGQSAQGFKPDGKEQVKPGASGSAPALATHRGEGSIEAVDSARATVTLAHGPITSLKWPAMTMDFRVKDPALLRTLKPGQKIAFEMIEASAGDYVIVRVQAAGEKSPSAASPASGERKGR
ncbi:MAG: efflux RND transporter periplasmic adaptor subunit [Burkholderiales bacterium]